MNDAWIADRMHHIDASGIRKAFDMARSMKDPINLSIGLPDFDVPDPAKAAAIAAIENGFNAYTQTQGAPDLREKLQHRVDAEHGHGDRQVLVTSGSSGGLLLGLCCSVNPGDEVILFDPYFVMYKHLVTLAGGTSVFVDTYPDFRIDLARVAAAITPKTKALLVNSPCNPTGVVPSADEMRGLAELCKRHNILMISDEVYRSFCYDGPFVSPASFNDETLVVDGFSKSHGMTGWRLGFAHGPTRLIQEMAKLQQFSFICAPSLVQKAGVAALDVDLTPQVDSYRHKRDAVVDALGDLYEMAPSSGAFYAFLKSPRGTASDFCRSAIDHNLLIIPGNVFSRRDTHFRISYAVDDRTLGRGLEVLKKMAKE